MTVGSLQLVLSRYYILCNYHIPSLCLQPDHHKWGAVGLMSTRATNYLAEYRSFSSKSSSRNGVVFYQLESDTPSLLTLGAAEVIERFTPPKLKQAILVSSGVNRLQYFNLADIVCITRPILSGLSNSLHQELPFHWLSIIRCQVTLVDIV